MKIFKKVPIEGTGGYIREAKFADDGWMWKCLDCSTVDTGFIDIDEAVEDLKEHAEVCF